MEDLKEKARIAREKAEAAKLAAGGGQDAANAKKAALEAARRRAAEGGEATLIADRAALDRAAEDKRAAEREATEKALAEKAAIEKTAAAKAEAEKAAQEKAALETAAAEKAATEKTTLQKAALEKAAAEKATAQKAALEKAAEEKAAAERAAAQKVSLEKAIAEKLAAEKAAVDEAARAKAAAENALAERAAAQKVALEKALAERVAEEKTTREKITTEKMALEKTASKKQAAKNEVDEVAKRNAVEAPAEVTVAHAEQMAAVPKLVCACVGAPSTPEVGAAVKIAYNMQLLYGTVRFVGVGDFAEGEVVGLALEKPVGKNDGSVMGKRYFQCEPLHGLFVRPKAILAIGTSFENLRNARTKSSKTSGKKAVKPSGKSPGTSGKKVDASNVVKEIHKPGGKSVGVSKKTVDAKKGFEESINKSFVVSPVRNLESAFTKEALADKKNKPAGTFRPQTSRHESNHIKTADGRHIDSVDFGMPGLSPLWSALGNVSANIKVQAVRWCEQHALINVDELWHSGRTEDFMSAVCLKPVQKRKAAEFFQRLAARSAAISPGKGVSDASVHVDLAKTLQEVMQSNEARIDLDIFRPSIHEFAPDLFGTMRECFLDLNTIISKVVNAKVWNNTRDSIGQFDVVSLVAESEKKLQKFIEEHVASLVAESEERLRTFVWESVAYCEKRLQTFVNESEDLIGKFDVVSLIADSEKKLKAFIHEHVLSFGAEGDERLEMCSREGDVAENEKHLQAFKKEHADPSKPAQVNPVANGGDRPRAFGSFAVESAEVNISGEAYQEAFEKAGGSDAMSKCSHIGDQLILTDPLWESQVSKLLPMRWKRQVSRAKLLKQRFAMNLEDLFAEARNVSEGFMGRICELADDTGGVADLLPSTPLDCAKLKLTWEYGSDAWHHMTDITSARIAYPNIDCMYRGLDRALDIFKGQVRECADYYLKPLNSGFRELCLVVEHYGHLCNLHLNTEPMLAAEKSYGGIRVLEIQKDIERASKEGNLAGCLSLLKWSSQLGIFLFMLPNFKGLHAAARSGHSAICGALLDHRADANSRDAAGNAPLHLAAQGGHDSAVWALLDRGKADSLLTNAAGETPLQSAALLLHAQPGNQGAVDAFLTLAHAASANHVREVVSRLEIYLADRVNMPLESF